MPAVTQIPFARCGKGRRGSGRRGLPGEMSVSNGIGRPRKRLRIACEGAEGGNGYAVSVADRKYNKPERDRAKRSGLRIFMLGRMFLPKTLRHDRTHRQEVLMTSVRAVSISRKVFVLPVVREKNWSRSFSVASSGSCDSVRPAVRERTASGIVCRGFVGASERRPVRSLACLLVRLGRPAPDGRQRAEVEAALTFPLVSSTRASRSVRGGGSEKICIVHYGNFNKFP